MIFTPVCALNPCWRKPHRTSFSISTQNNSQSGLPEPCKNYQIKIMKPVFILTIFLFSRYALSLKHISFMLSLSNSIFLSQVCPRSFPLHTFIEISKACRFFKAKPLPGFYLSSIQCCEVRNLPICRSWDLGCRSWLAYAVNKSIRFFLSGILDLALTWLHSHHMVCYRCMLQRCKLQYGYRQCWIVEGQPCCAIDVNSFLISGFKYKLYEGSIFYDTIMTHRSSTTSHMILNMIRLPLYQGKFVHGTIVDHWLHVAKLFTPLHIYAFLLPS